MRTCGVIGVSRADHNFGRCPGTFCKGCHEAEHKGRELKGPPEITWPTRRIRDSGKRWRNWQALSRNEAV